MNLTMSTSGFWDKLERVTEERDTLVDRNEKLTVALKEIAGLNPGYDTAGTAVRIAKRGLRK